MRNILLSAPAILATAGTVEAQPRERGFVSVNGGLHAASPGVTDTFTYDVNAEASRVDVRYPSPSTVLLDGAIGFAMFKFGGIAVGVSHASAGGAAHVEADVPHPFFDDQDRHVSGDADGLNRKETAIHADVYWRRAAGRWRLRLMGGASYFRVEQDAVTGLHVNETYPFDVATFRSVATGKSTGSGPGFNIGADASWLLTRTMGLGALVRFTRGSVSLNVEGSRDVSIDTGGVQAGAGVRFIF